MYVVVVFALNDQQQLSVQLRFYRSCMSLSEWCYDHTRIQQERRMNFVFKNNETPTSGEMPSPVLSLCILKLPQTFTKYPLIY